MKNRKHKPNAEQSVEELATHSHGLGEIFPNQKPPARGGWTVRMGVPVLICVSIRAPERESGFYRNSR